MPISVEMSHAAKVALRLFKERRLQDLMAFCTDSAQEFINEVKYNLDDFFLTPPGQAVATWTGHIEDYFILPDLVCDLYVNVKFNEIVDPVSGIRYDCYVQLMTNILRPPVKYLFNKFLLEVAKPDSRPASPVSSLTRDKVDSFASMGSFKSMGDLGSRNNSSRFLATLPPVDTNINDDMGRNGAQTTPADAFYGSNTNTPILTSESKMMASVSPESMPTPSSILSTGSISPSRRGRKKVSVFGHDIKSGEFNYLKSLLNQQNAVKRPDIIPEIDEDKSMKSSPRRNNHSRNSKSEDDAYYSMYPGGDQHNLIEDKSSAISAVTASIRSTINLAHLLQLSNEDVCDILQEIIKDLSGKRRGTTETANGRDQHIDDDAATEERQVELMLRVLNNVHS